MVKNDAEKSTKKNDFQRKSLAGGKGDGGMRNATERSSPVGTRCKSRTESIPRQHPGGVRRIQTLRAFRRPQLGC